MLTLNYRKPSKIHRSELIEQPKIPAIAPNHYRVSTVITEYGVVCVEEMKWEHNFGVDEFTIFSTTKDKIKYIADLPQAPLTAYIRKRLATIFMKKISSCFNHEEIQG